METRERTGKGEGKQRCPRNGSLMKVLRPALGAPLLHIMQPGLQDERCAVWPPGQGGRPAGRLVCDSISGQQRPPELSGQETRRPGVEA